MNERERIDLRHRFIINNAMAAERLLKDKIDAHPMRQVYHVSPVINWMNDPCAMIWLKGYYHLFYQYDPYHVSPRGMYFGQVRSSDLVHWERLPIALAPSEWYELYERDVDGRNFGVFTGSACVDGDRMVVMYCGSSYDDEGNLKECICLASSEDGIHFEKYEHNPVIAGPPADGSRDFRDPKLWKHDGRWYLLMGSCKDGKGKALLYVSDTLTEWTYLGVMAESDGSFGRMWECPDFFRLGEYDVLIFSPIGMKHVDACWIVGHLCYETGKFEMLRHGKIDFGKEFYAPQTLEAPDGRRIMIGWENMWAHDGRDTFTTFGTTRTEGWCGHMSIPRELSLDEDLNLRVVPVQECTALRHEPRQVCRYRLENNVVKAPFSGWKASELIFRVEESGPLQGRCGVRVRCAEGYYTEIGWDAGKNAIYLDRQHADGVCYDVQEYIRETAALPEIRIFTDSVGIELFADDGRIRASNNIYPDPGHTGLSLFAEDQACTVTLTGWELRL